MEFKKIFQKFLANRHRGEKSALRNYLILDFRNYGDSVIIARLLTSSSDADTNIIAVATKKSKIPIYQSMGFKGSLITVDFEIEKNKIFRIRNIFSIIIFLVSNFKRYYSVINLYGDLRESLISFCLYSPLRIAPRWNAGHIWSKSCFTWGYFLNNRQLPISLEELSVYKNFENIFRYAGLKWVDHKVISKFTEKKHKVGIHCFASHKSREIPKKLLTGIISNLNQMNTTPSIYCGSNAEEVFLKNLLSEKNKFAIIHVPLVQIIDEIGSCETVIATDSFGAHIASAAGCRVVFLSSSNDFRLWLPPGATPIVAEKVECGFFPCINKPTCLGTNFEFDCMNNIRIERIHEMASK